MKYVIHNTKGRGFAESKYPDMFNDAPLHGVKRFETREDAEKVCASLHKAGHTKYQVADTQTAALSAIKHFCEWGENAEVCDENRCLFRNLFQHIEDCVEVLLED